MPVPLLEQFIDAEHFEELMLYRKLYTLDPIGWQQAGKITAAVKNVLVSDSWNLTQWWDVVPGTAHHEPQVQSDEEIAETLLAVLPVHGS